jgi:hypothetical protein
LLLDFVALLVELAGWAVVPRGLGQASHFVERD